MSKDQQSTVQPQAAEPDLLSKRAYTKPEFRHETVFETMALACGKIGGTGGQCNVVPSAS